MFDLDGTLLDTETLSTQAIQMVLDGVAPGTRIEWELKRQLLGLPGTVWGPMVVKELNLQGLIEPTALVAQWEANLSTLAPSVTKMPGALATVDLLHATGVPMAIATSSTSAGVSKKRHRHGDLFDKVAIVVCGDDPEVVLGKPAPDLFLIGARRLSVAPAECVAVEDSLAGVLSALAAGMFVVAVPDPRAEMEPFAQAIAQQGGGRGEVWPRGLDPERFQRFFTSEC